MVNITNWRKEQLNCTTEIAVVWTVSLGPRNVRCHTGLLSIRLAGVQCVSTPITGWFCGFGGRGSAHRDHVRTVQFLAAITRHSIQCTERWELSVDWAPVKQDHMKPILTNCQCSPSSHGH